MSRQSPSAARGRRPALALALGALLLVAAVGAAISTSARTAADGAGTAVSYDRESQVLDFRLTTFDESAVDSAELRGTPLVLNFYASWCTVCDRELPDFERVSQQLGDRVQVLGVNPQSNDTDAAQAAMITRNGVTYPTLRDPQDELLRQFNTTGGLPTTVFVDADGVVRAVHNGLLTEELLLDAVASALGVRS